MVGLKDNLKGRVLILGVGNLLKQDDGAGPHFVKKCRMPNAECRTNVILLDVGTAPENYSGKIKQIKPDTLVIVDAVDFSGRPGEIKVFDVDEFGVRSFSTHNVSLKTFAGFLRADLPDLSVIIVGIQPKEVNFGEGLSPEAQRAVDELCESLVKGG